MKTLIHWGQPALPGRQFDVCLATIVLCCMLGPLFMFKGLGSLGADAVFFIAGASFFAFAAVLSSKRLPLPALRAVFELSTRRRRALVDLLKPEK